MMPVPVNLASGVAWHSLSPSPARLQQTNDVGARACAMTVFGTGPVPTARARIAFENDLREHTGLYRKGEVDVNAEISRERSSHMAQHEDNAGTGAGRLAINPLFEAGHVPAQSGRRQGSNGTSGPSGDCPATTRRSTDRS